MLPGSHEPITNSSEGLNSYVWGFGVAGGQHRVRDERLDLIDAAARRHGHAIRPYYQAAFEAAEAIAEATGKFPNMGLGVAAIGLDLGMDRGQIEAMVYQMLEPQILGNAFDAARSMPPSLREARAGSVQFVGSPARRSLRREESDP
ncbi:MAG: hypothetical protein KF729_16990 [Sandaracinaceae bacterium]|nr:hypothetical protein [Sandaracinaceae bacterium]